MNLIVAVDKNWAIGNNNQLLIRIPDDLKNFRQLTEGNVVILGRTTLQTFPNGLPLKNRTNIVITRNEEFKAGDALIAHSIEEAVSMAKEYNSEDVFVIGGGQIYEQLLPFVDTAYVTWIDYSYNADTYFPNLDKSDEWVVSEESEEQTYFDVEYYYRKYVRKKA